MGSRPMGGQPTWTMICGHATSSISSRETRRIEGRRRSVHRLLIASRAARAAGRAGEGPLLDRGRAVDHNVPMWEARHDHPMSRRTSLARWVGLIGILLLGV